MPDHFEAKKHAYRQTQDGIVVSFVIHPNDMSSALATAALGTRYMVAFAEIGDDGKPITSSPHSPPVSGEPGEAKLAKVPANDGIAGSASQDRRPFDSLPLSQQAAILCQDEDFREWLKFNYHDTATDGPEAAAEVVRRACGVKSRRDLDTDREAGISWGGLCKTFLAHRTDQRYAHLRRT